jgi:hypothetical protein
METFATRSATLSPSIRNSRSNKNKSCFRMEYLSLLIALLFFKQLRRPLEQFSGVEVNFKSPVMMRVPSNEALQQMKDAQAYAEADEDLFDDPDESHDSHDSLVQELTPPAMKLMEDYQYHHSQPFMEDEASGCRERTNTHESDSIADAIQDDWCPELQERHFLVVTLNCDESQGVSGIQMLQEFLRSIAWAVVTGRTVLYKQSYGKDDTCTGEACSELCEGIAQVDPWLPRFDIWNKEYDWGDLDIPVLDISKLEDVNTPKVVMLDHPPPLSLKYLETLSSQRKAEQMMDWGMLYGMILDETIVMEASSFPRADSSDEDATVTHRYAVQAQALGESLECPLVYESPCVIYQVGTDAVNSSDCEVEQTTYRYKYESHPASKRTMFQTISMAGNAIHGVVLERKYPLSDLLVELLKYRGRLEDRYFELNVCWADKGRRQNLR